MVYTGKLIRFYLLSDLDFLTLLLIKIAKSPSCLYILSNLNKTSIATNIILHQTYSVNAKINCK